MTLSFVFRAVWLFGAGLVVAGLVLVLYFAGLLVWQFGAPGLVDPVLAWLSEMRPELRPGGWLANLRVGMVFAVLGVVLALLGVLVAARQHGMREHRHAERAEPYIGTRDVEIR